MPPETHSRCRRRGLALGGLAGLSDCSAAGALPWAAASAAFPWLRIGEGTLAVAIGAALILFIIHYRHLRKEAAIFQEYRQTAAALRESEQRYRGLVECSPDPIAVHCDGHVVFVNPAAVALFGAQTEADLIGRPVLDFVHPSSRDLVLARIRQGARTGEKLPMIEETFQRVDGAPVEVEVTSMPLLYQGRPALQVLARDISERKRAEQQLRASEERYRAFSELVSDFAYVFRVDDEHHLRDEWISASFADVTGYSVAEARDLDWIGLLHPDDAPRAMTKIAQILRNASAQAELRIVTKDRRTRWLRVYSHPAWDAEQRRVIKVYGAAQDITDRKQAELDLHAAHREAERGNKAKEAFLTTISHELRTPLNAILGYIQMFERNDRLSPKERDEITAIHRSADHLLAMINAILDFSDIDSRALQLETRDIALPDFLRSVIDMAQLAADRRGLQFQADLDDKLPAAVLGDERRLRQALLNVLNNAIKFTETGAVVFRARRCAPGPVAKIRFQVEDQGIGIAPEHLSEIFQPFQQIDDKRFYAHGVGLGLTISHRLIAMMGGRLRVNSVPGQGSTFWFELALPEIAARPGSSPVSPRRIVGYRRRGGDGAAEAGAAAPFRVLVADDNPEHRRMVRDLLEPLGCLVSEAKHGLAAAACVERHHPELILLNMLMPASDGLEALRRIRQQAGADRIVMLGMSANVTDDLRQQCLQAGCQALLPKPCDAPTLLEAMESYAPIEWVSADGAAQRRQGELSAASFPARSAAAEPPPPPELIRTLHDAATSGDVAALRAYAQRLREQAQHPVFVERFERLLRSYQMNNMTRFLSAYLAGDCV